MRNTTARRGGLTAAGAAFVAAVTVLTGTGDGAGAQPDCGQPYSPLASADRYSGSQETLPEVRGENRISGPEIRQLDSDGDGVADEVVAKGVITDPSSLTRSDGTLTFERPGTLVGSPRTAGDLDGDGADEIQVSVYADTGWDLIGAYVVPGSIDPGTHDPARVGIELATAVIPVDDRDGDGIVDLIEWRDRGDARLLSGAAVWSVGAPGDATSISPLVDLRGEFLGFADLGGALPSIITGELVDDGAVLHLWDGTEPRSFQTAPYPFVSNYTSTFAAPQVLVSDDGSYLRLSQSERSAARGYLWRIDEPCGDLPGSGPSAPAPSGPGAPRPPVTPQAPGAQPVGGASTYTG